MEEKRLTPIKAIRAKCLDCCCGNSNEVKLCTCTGCALYPYREGHSPFIQKQELICKGWFLPPNTYDCGSFVVNGTAVVGKEPKKPYNRCKSTQKGAELYEISI